MTSLTLNNITNLTNNSAVSTINANSAAIVTAMENSLAQDGSDDVMTGPLDMNSNRIINLPAPQSLSDAARLQDVNGSPVIVSTGTTNELAYYNSASTLSGLIVGANLSISGNTLVGGISGGIVSLSGNNNFTGTNTFSGSSIFAGPATFTGTTAFTGTYTFKTLGGFRANLGGSTFTYSTPNPNFYVSLPMSTVVFNTNSTFISTGSTPYSFQAPSTATLVHLDAQILVSTGYVNDASAAGKWVKNYSLTASGYQMVATGSDVVAGIGTMLSTTQSSVVMRISAWDKPSPGDYYGLFLYANSATVGAPITVEGNAAHTYMSAFCF